MQTETFSSLTMDSRSFVKKVDCVYVFAVDASSSMLLQAAPFGQCSRAKAAVQLISRQIFNLSKADNGRERFHFITIGYNANNGLINTLSPKQMLEYYPNPTVLSDFLFTELEKLGGEQHTNKGLSLIKKSFDDLLFKRNLSNQVQLRGRSGTKTYAFNNSNPQIKLCLFTDANDAVERNLENPFANAKLECEPLVGIFIGQGRTQPGWIALRQILSKCGIHGKKQLFALDGFESFWQLESMQFLSFDKNPHGVLCPSCLQAERTTTPSQNEPLNLTLSGPDTGMNDQATGGISAELFVSAGPRKDDDIALGEDAAGVIVEEKWASFWVADGTSESPVMMDFSSRSMALELGAHFVDELNRIPKKELSDRIKHDPTLVSILLEKAFACLLSTWTTNLDDLLKSESTRKYIDSAFKLNDQTMKVTSKTHFEFIDFSTTFLCGLVTGSGTGQAACIGDCPLCIGGDNGLQVYRLSNNRIFARLRKTENGYKFDHSSISEDIITKKFTKANIVVAGSDGIGKLPEFLAAQMKSFGWSEIRKHIHRFTPKSHDDKTFCVIHVG